MIKGLFSRGLGQKNGYLSGTEYLAQYLLQSFLKGNILIVYFLTGRYRIL